LQQHILSREHRHAVEDALAEESASDDGQSEDGTDRTAMDNDSAARDFGRAVMLGSFRPGFFFARGHGRTGGGEFLDL
jgi:hypothetical protein